MRALVITTLIASDTPVPLYSYTIHTRKENGWSVYDGGLVETWYQILWLLGFRPQCHRTVYLVFMPMEGICETDQNGRSGTRG